MRDIREMGEIRMKRLLIVLEIAVLIIFLFWHGKIGLVRYFDADEFAHLHWGYSLSIGERPYTDFFYLFPPFFLYTIASIFQIFGRTIQAILAARMMISAVFMVTSAVLFLIAKKLRNISFALLVVVFFAFLPLPFDKMIEIRPDMVATGWAMLGLYFFMKGDEGNKGNEGDKGKQGKYFFLSGLAYALSLGFVPKTVFFLVPVGVVTGYRWIRRYEGNKGDRRREVIYFAGGFLVVGLALFFLIASYGNFSFAIYSMTRMASEVTKTLGVKFYMRPDIFFYPNDTYYGFGGWSIQLVSTIIIYVSASIWAIHRLITAGLGGYGENGGDGGRAEFLVAGSFFANLTAFVYFYPLKHAQYLITVAPFVAFYFADAVIITIIKVIKIIWIRTGLLIVVLALVSFIGFQMNERKIQWVNKGTLDKVSYFLETIPASEAVYDLTGESIFFRNGYYFCCLPYGQYEEALYFRLPNLEKELDKRGTKYVHIGMLTRLNEIPARHARYIKENFVPITEGSLLWKRK